MILLYHIFGTLTINIISIIDPDRAENAESSYKCKSVWLLWILWQLP